MCFDPSHEDVNSHIAGSTFQPYCFSFPKYSCCWQWLVVLLASGRHTLQATNESCAFQAPLVHRCVAACRCPSFYCQHFFKVFKGQMSVTCMSPAKLFAEGGQCSHSASMSSFLSFLPHVGLQPMIIFIMDESGVLFLLFN